MGIAPREVQHGTDVAAGVLRASEPTSVSVATLIERHGSVLVLCMRERARARARALHHVCLIG